MRSPRTVEPRKPSGVFDNNQIVIIDQTITKPTLIDVQDSFISTSLNNQKFNKRHITNNSCPNSRRFNYRIPVSSLMQVERDGIDLLPLSDLEDEEIVRHKENDRDRYKYQERISSLESNMQHVYASFFVRTHRHD